MAHIIGNDTKRCESHQVVKETHTQISMWFKPTWFLTASSKKQSWAWSLGYYQSACHLVHNSYNLLNTTSTKARWITLQKLFHYFFVGATSCRPLFYWKLFEQVWPGDIHYLWWVPWIWYIFCIAWANAYLLTYTFRDYCYLVVAEKSHTGLQLKIIAQHYMGMPVMACSHKQGQNLKH